MQELSLFSRLRYCRTQADGRPQAKCSSRTIDHFKRWYLGDVASITRRLYTEWPAYDLAPLYDQSSLSGLEEDVRTVAKIWFKHDAHESVERFVADLPLGYFEFQPHDRYTGSTQYDIPLLMRLFLLKELHGWGHETALVEYLKQRPSLCHRLHLSSVPD